MSRRHCPDCGDLQVICDKLGGCELPPCKPESNHEWCSPSRCAIAREMLAEEKRIDRLDELRELAEEHAVDAYIDRMRGC